LIATLVPQSRLGTIEPWFWAREPALWVGMTALVVGIYKLKARPGPVKLKN
jgi:hypothetical protein